MYSVKLRFKQSQELKSCAEKRFALINKCHNILVSRARKLLKQLKHDAEYASLLDAYHRLKEAKATKEELKAVSVKLNIHRQEIGLSEAGLQAYIAVWQRQNRKNISSHQAQKEATRVWAGVSKVLFGDGEKVHFRKVSDCRTITSKSPKNGLSFDRDHMRVSWLGHVFPLKPIGKNSYLRQALKLDTKEELPVSYCEIQREMFSDGWHYYLRVYIKGEQPKKYSHGEFVGGIDPGVSTVAYASNGSVILQELAPESKVLERQIRRQQKTVEHLTRLANPDNYNKDGTAKKGLRKWKITKHCERERRKLRSLYRLKSAKAKQSHCILANRIMQDAAVIFIETMNFKALQRRSKKTERSERESVVQDKHGKQKTVRKYKRKKRFGRTLFNRSPSSFVSILKMKGILHGVPVLEIDTVTYKASQYSHETDKCKPVYLRERWKTIGNHKVQRDLYSAFLIAHPDADCKKASRTACAYDFSRFLRLQDEEIEVMKRNQISFPQCFGF